MNLIADTWRGLVRRRLWPLALLLLAALVAIPIVLAKHPSTAAPLPHADATAKAGADDDATASFVNLAEAPAAGSRRRVLGQAKDPFQPEPRPKTEKKKTTAADATATVTPTATPSGSDAPGTGGTTPPGSEPPASPTPTPAPTVPKYSIKVRFGLSDSDEQPLSTLQRLEPLTSNDAPVLVYEGVEDGGKVAVFSIPGSVTAQGDGTCKPSLEDCATLKLKAGETEFITVTDTGDEATDAQFQLELVKIYSKATAVSADANAKASSSSQSKLKDYRFDATTGTLHRVTSRSRRASP
jgi:hypothetical protein